MMRHGDLIVQLAPALFTCDARSYCCYVFV